MIDVKKLVKLYGPKKVLNGLDFQARKGEFVALLGPNGAGKSTFLRILASLLKPTSGDVWVAGHHLPGQAASVRAHIGVVTHQPLLYGELTAEENLFFYGRMYNVQEITRRMNEVFELIDLVHRRKDLVRMYSRGMQQRLSIARALLHDPEILLLDEPHTGLDQEACDRLDSVLRGLMARGRTIVMTSHDLKRAELLASRFDVLLKGCITASMERSSLQDTLADFYNSGLQN